MNSKTIKANNKYELQLQLVEIYKASFKASLAFVFIQDKSLSLELITPFYDYDIEIFGSCSAELIYNEGKSEFAIIALLLDIPKQYFRLKVYNEIINSFEMGNNIADFSLTTFQKPSILILAALKDNSFEIEKLLGGILARDKELKIFGGIASSFGEIENPPFVSSEGFENKGVCVLILDEQKIQINGLAVSGWQELGTPKKVTKSQGRKVFEIEGIAATDFYARYFGFKQNGKGIRKNHIDPDLLAASEFPLLIHNEDGSTVMRIAIQMDFEEKSVSYGGDIPQGSSVRFCSPNTMDTIQHSYEEMSSFRNNIKAEIPDFILMFNCAVRSRSLGSYMNTELKAIHNLWKKPIIGFSSWGEIGNSKNSTCGLHNTVISIVAIRDVTNKIDDLTQSDFPKQEEFLYEPSQENLSELDMKKEIEQLRRDKRILGHFLRLTSDDLDKEETKSSKLLLNILPEETASRLKAGEINISQRVESASVLFADIVGFTSLAAKTDPEDLIAMLNKIFTKFDDLTLSYGIEKIKTIGDAYMVAAGVPNQVDKHADLCVYLGKDMITFMKEFSLQEGLDLKIRIGINSGVVTAGVIGKHKFTYDLWGDTVNLAQRMESNSDPNSILLSENTFQLIQDKSYFISKTIDVKGKGLMEAYLYSML
ncbi:adenylate/guanylate cyclase domain-containing protein [Leptospira sp. GIMC2001]|uniref:adenylate/guanylate cyclase domain-containing protein n=1 Tax=Leptospira sp. GIMC2001 TaxID=1513297 RepID=UPI00234B1478|nr:adenylate/guanylate cyclase domain-containing protein [Leptospira sp. GIMC2001]WCL49168.1 FIST C-terminal domain-containing protein [Leptospira sp. GIMC2001]